MVSTGTSAIQLALQALHLPPNSRVAVPAATFSGTGLAIRAAGHLPVLCDVDAQSWHLQPSDVPAACAAAVPVAAFGMPVNIGPWVAWADAMNKPVVVDAAGALLDQPTCDSPLVLFAFSLHATKFIGAGEGGCVAGASRWLLDRVADLSRFGMVGGTNAKMSEYHAAVAHASLDSADTRCEHMRMTRHRYHSRLLKRIPGIQFQRPPIELLWRGAASLMPILLPEDRPAMPTMHALERVGVETRQWYRPFLNERPDMPVSPSARRFGDDMPVTMTLIERLIGLPFHYFLTLDDIDAVCHHLETICAS